MKLLALRDGRSIELHRLKIEATFGGQMEGSYESASRHILASLEAESRSTAIQVHNGSVPLAKFRCDAYFRSSALAGRSSDTISDLTVVWFTDRIPDSISRLLAPLRDQIDWPRHARGFDPFDW